MILLNNFIINEVVKASWHRGEEPQVYFWRIAAGVEVDVVLEVGGQIVPIEIKLSAMPRPAMVAGILTLRQDLGEKVEPGYVIHPGEIQLPLAPGVRALPFIEWLNMDSSQFGALCDQQC